MECNFKQMCLCSTCRHRDTCGCRECAAFEINPFLDGECPLYENEKPFHVRAYKYLQLKAKTITLCIIIAFLFGQVVQKMFDDELSINLMANIFSTFEILAAVVLACIVGWLSRNGK